MSKRRREAQKQRHEQELNDLRLMVSKLQIDLNLELDRANHYRDKWQADQLTFREIHSVASTIVLDSLAKRTCHCSMLADKICSLVPNHIKVGHENTL